MTRGRDDTGTEGTRGLTILELLVTILVTSSEASSGQNRSITSCDNNPGEARTDR